MGFERWVIRPGTSTIERWAGHSDPGDVVVMPVREHEAEVGRLAEQVRRAVDAIRTHETAKLQREGAQAADWELWKASADVAGEREDQQHEQQDQEDGHD